MTALRRLLVGVSALVAGAATAETPSHPIAPLTVSENAFSWRKLTVADFRASEPPPELLRHGDRLGAVSCVFVTTEGGTPRATPAIDRDAGTRRVRIHIAGLRVESRFDPDCSWWNPETRPERVAYTLLHEQIHFALAEIAARRLQRMLAEEERLEASAASGELASARIQLKLQMAMRAVSRELRLEHERFDEETSASYDPIALDHWRALVEAELGETPSGSDVEPSVPAKAE